MAKKNFQKFQQALFTRSAKMMSYELHHNREAWDMEFEYMTAKARQQHRRRFKRTCTYCMHTCHEQLVKEIITYLIH